jgi:hypothetical protein
VIVRTWTMSGGAQLDFEYKFWEAALRSKVHLDFRALEITTEAALDGFIGYARNNWHEKAPFFILTEEDTKFGSLPEHLRRFLQADVNTIPFPRNLSQLRNAAEQQGHTPGRSDDALRNEMPRIGLQLSLRQDHPARLEIPTFSEQRPISEESVLFTISGLLKTHTVHYVGILATDPLDTLFLTRFIRSACPNIRVFTTSPDLIFEHGSDADDFSGVIGVSAYPLFPFSQAWSGRTGGAIYPFADHGAEAVYNSAVEILEDSPRPKDTRDEEDPFDASARPLWITVAGRTGFEPVTVVPVLRDENRNAREWLHPSFEAEYWPGWGYIFLIILLIAVTYCALMVFARPNSHPALALFSATPDAYVAGVDYDPAPRAFYLFAIGMCLSLLITVWIVAPAIILEQNRLFVDLDRTHIQEFQLLFAGFVLVVVLTLAARFLDSLRLGTEAQLTGQRAEKAALLGMLGPVAFALPCLLDQLFIQPPLIQPPPTSVLPALWLLVGLGCFVLGTTLAASFLPLRNLASYRATENPALNFLDKWLPKKYWLYEFGLVCMTAISLMAIWFALVTVKRDRPDDFMAAFRALDLTNGVSPLVPATLLMVGLTVLAFVQLRRMAYYDDRCPEVPTMSGDDFCPKLRTLAADVSERVRKFTVHCGHWIVLSLTVILATFVFRAPRKH